MHERTIKTLEYNKIIDMIVDRASSFFGKELAKELKPIDDYEIIQKQLTETSDATWLLIKKGMPPLGGIHDTRMILKRVDIGGVLNPGELLKVSRGLYAARRLKQYLTNDKIQVQVENTIAQMINTLEINKKLEDKIQTAIISEDELSDHASPKLSSIRRKIRVEQDSVKDKLNNVLRSQTNKKYMQDAVVTMRGDRYVIPVKQEHRDKISGVVHDSSSSGATLFIEPMTVVQTNNKIREYKTQEAKEIERILQELTNDIYEVINELRANTSILGELDFIFAKAKLSLDYDCVCPKLVKRQIINLKKARHPLLEKKSAVPISVHLGRDYTVLVITGPNTGGKTVTLKTIGLLLLMTQSGLHIPVAEGSEIGIFNSIYADIGDEQSIEQSLSTFSSHMKNIVNILKEVNRGSLVLFDELGAGTDPDEGAALAISILDMLKKRRICTAATTHYSELKLYALQTKYIQNACCEFDVKTLKPTYKLLLGIPGKSNAFAISKRLGLSDKIIENAKECMDNDNLQFEDVLNDIETNRTKTEEERELAEKHRMDIEKQKQAIDKKHDTLEKQKEDILNNARQDAKKIMNNAKEEAEELIKKIRVFEKEMKTGIGEHQVRDLKVQADRKIDSLNQKINKTVFIKRENVNKPKGLKPGDSVKIISLNQKATVLSKPDKDENVQVQAGIMKINVQISNLQYIDEQKETNKKIHKTTVTGVRSKPMSMNFDIRGTNVEEAMPQIDKYLDDAKITGLHEITIIHGKGTGVLRKAVHDFLKRHPHVKSYRLGKFGEGETGVTVVELK